MHLRIATLTCLLLASCASDAPTNAVILPETTAPKLLMQCSRSAPTNTDGVWQPTTADIRKLETMLPEALAQMPQAKTFDHSDIKSNWHRQYVGVIRDGQKVVYGNFFPKDLFGAEKWRTQPVIVCDGGARFFGVEYNTQVGRIVRIAFNGSV